MKNRMKKIMALLLAGVMCVSLSACGSGDDKESKESSSTDKKTEAKTGMTIAQNSFVSGDYAFGIMKKASEVVIEGS